MLTTRQHELVLFIANYVATNGYAPSFEEMRVGLGLHSKSGIHRMIVGLEERGYVRRLRYRGRAVELLRMPDANVTPARKQATRRVIGIKVQHDRATETTVSLTTAQGVFHFTLPVVRALLLRDALRNALDEAQRERIAA